MMNNMTAQEKVRNGLKFDSIEIRRDIEKLNFSTIVFFLTWIITEVFMHTGNMYINIFLITITIIGLGYGLEMFRLLLKMDYLFMGQYVRDAESVGRWIVSLFRKNKNN